jgi:hypothetical protein
MQFCWAAPALGSLSPNADGRADAADRRSGWLPASLLLTSLAAAAALCRPMLRSPLRSGMLSLASLVATGAAGSLRLTWTPWERGRRSRALAWATARTVAQALLAQSFGGERSRFPRARRERSTSFRSCRRPCRLL